MIHICSGFPAQTVRWRAALLGACTSLVLFDLASRRAILIAQTHFATPYSISQPAWRNDSRAISFEYNERGHQRYRIIEVDAESGETRIVLEERAATANKANADAFISLHFCNRGLCRLLI